MKVAALLYPGGLVQPIPAPASRDEAADLCGWEPGTRITHYGTTGAHGERQFVYEAVPYFRVTDPNRLMLKWFGILVEGTVLYLSTAEFTAVGAGNWR